MNSILEYSHPYPPAKSTFRSRSHSASSSEAADAAAEEQLCPTSDNVLEELSERQEVAPHPESEPPVVKSSANGDELQDEEEEEPSTLSKVQGLLKSRHSSKSSVASSSEDEEAEDKRVNHPVPEDFVQVVPDTTHGKETAKS